MLFIFLHVPLQPFFSMDSTVQWPDWSSCDVELGHGGETIIRSQEGQAVLSLSPSGEEFSVEFPCSLSQTQNQHHNMQGSSRDSVSSPDSQQQANSQTIDDETKQVHQGRESRRNESVRSRSCSPQITSSGRPKVMPLSNISMFISQLWLNIQLPFFSISARGKVPIHHSDPASLLLHFCPHLVLPSPLGSTSLDETSLWTWGCRGRGSRWSHPGTGESKHVRYFSGREEITPSAGAAAHMSNTSLAQVESSVSLSKKHTCGALSNSFLTYVFKVENWWSSGCKRTLRPRSSNRRAGESDVVSGSHLQVGVLIFKLSRTLESKKCFILYITSDRNCSCWP